MNDNVRYQHGGELIVIKSGGRVIGQPSPLEYQTSLDPGAHSIDLYEVCANRHCSSGTRQLVA